MVASSSACTAAAWGKTSQVQIADGNACLNVQVPADHSDATDVKLGRFFPESASWCFQVVDAGSPAPAPCTPERVFEGNFTIKAGANVDVYVVSNDGKFVTVTVGPAATEELEVTAKKCTAGTWGTSAQLQPGAKTKKACLNIQVPADYSGDTTTKLGRFFPESSSWCFSVVDAGTAAKTCTPSRTFSEDFTLAAGSNVDVYVETDQGTFTTLTVGPAATEELETTATACTAGTWGKTAQVQIDGPTCLNLQVPADYSGDTVAKLGRFFPESASWCFSVVDAGTAAKTCTPTRTFSEDFTLAAGSNVDVYVVTDSGKFATVTVGPPALMAWA